mgnify:CR=1 FL=1
MALIKCYECSKEISDTAKACPHCGAGKAVECHECSKQISENLDSCPNCGAPKVRFIKINNRIIKFILLSFTIFSGFWVWYFFMRCIVDAEFMTASEFWIHLFSGFICTSLTFYLPYHAFYKIDKNKQGAVIKTYDFIRNKRTRNITIIAIIISTTIGMSTYFYYDIHRYLYGEETDNLQREITPEMMNDGYTGKGTSNHKGMKYVGEFKDGVPNGQGTVTHAGGMKYVGEWKNGDRNGQGTLTYADGGKYEGEWKDNKQDGQGTLTFGKGHRNEGDKYVGEFKNMEFHGRGTYTSADGEVKKGRWYNGTYRPVIGPITN